MFHVFFCIPKYVRFRGLNLKIVIFRFRAAFARKLLKRIFRVHKKTDILKMLSKLDLLANALNTRQVVWTARMEVLKLIPQGPKRNDPLVVTIGFSSLLLFSLSEGRYFRVAAKRVAYWRPLIVIKQNAMKKLTRKE